jgi:hypothetical protein
MLLIALVCFAQSVFMGDASFAEEASESGQTVEPPPVLPEGPEVVVQRYLFWPLIFIEESAEWRQLSITPVYVERETKDGSEKKVQFLWPLYLFRRQDKDVTIRIFPFYTYWRDVYEYADSIETNMQYMLFPIIYGGESTEEGGYFAVFPVGGKIKHFLGRDQIDFILFPLYLSYAKDSVRQRNFVWPVLSFTHGGEYNGFRLWPIYGYFQKENEYRNTFAAWPIYNYQQYDLDKEQPGERLFIFPFYARDDGARRHYRAIIWPFFTYEQNIAGNYVEKANPWPFIVMSRGDVYRTQYWPFYGHTMTEDAESTFVAWPFWHRRWYETPDGVKRQSMLLPVFASQTEFSQDQKILFHKSRLWPLWRFRRYEDGSSNFRMLSLLWFDDEPGFERQYSPLWTLYERTSAPGGYVSTYALWRLYRHRETPVETESQVPLLFTSQRDNERDIEDLRILGGFFGKHREGSKENLRLLYFINIER